VKGRMRIIDEFIAVVTSAMKDQSDTTEVNLPLVKKTLNDYLEAKYGS
jgi:hypothetical protein